MVLNTKAYETKEHCLHYCWKWADRKWRFREWLRWIRRLILSCVRAFQDRLLSWFAGAGLVSSVHDED